MQDNSNNGTIVSFPASSQTRFSTPLRFLVAFVVTLLIEQQYAVFLEAFYF